MLKNQTNVVEFVKVLLEVGLLESKEETRLRNRFMTDDYPIGDIYEEVMKHENWEKLIYVWENTGNEHIISELHEKVKCNIHTSTGAKTPKAHQSSSDHEAAQASDFSIRNPDSPSQRNADRNITPTSRPVNGSRNSTVNSRDCQNDSNTTIRSTGISANDIYNNGNISVTVMLSPSPSSNGIPNPFYINLSSTSPYFDGRDNEIKNIEEEIGKRIGKSHEHQRTIILQGFGGVGKSEIARGFANKNKSKYDYIVWIDCTNKLTVNNTFIELSEALNMQGCRNDAKAIQRRMSDLKLSGIFIFDNAECLDTTDDQHGIQEYFYDNGSQSNPIYLVTSRNGRSSWGGSSKTIKIIKIKFLTDEYARNILKKHMDIENNDTANSLLDDFISSIVTTLGGFALGLEMVGKELHNKIADDSCDDRSQETSLQNKIGTYNDNLKSTNPATIITESKFPAKLEEYLNLALTKIKKHDTGQVAVRILSIIGYLDTENLYSRLVEGIFSGTCCDGSERGIGKNPKVKRAVKLLRDCSILTLGSKDHYLRIHKMIQECARNLLTEANHREAIDKIVKFFHVNKDSSSWTDQIAYCIEIIINDSLTKKLNYCDGDCLISLVGRYIKAKSDIPFCNTSEMERGVDTVWSQCPNFWKVLAIVTLLKQLLEQKPLTDPSRKRLSSLIFEETRNLGNEQMMEVACRGLFKDEHISRRDIAREFSLISKLMSSRTTEQMWSKLFEDIFEIQFRQSENKMFLDCVFTTYGVSLYEPFLMFDSDKAREEFVKSSRLYNFTMCLHETAKLGRNVLTFVNSETFTTHFMSLFGAFLVNNYPTQRTVEFILLISVLFRLFDHRPELYYKFQADIEGNFVSYLMKVLLFTYPENIFNSLMEHGLNVPLDKIAEKFKRFNKDCKWVDLLVSVCVPTISEEMFYQKIMQAFDMKLLFEICLCGLRKNEKKSIAMYRFPEILKNLLALFKSGDTLELFLESHVIHGFLDLAKMFLEDYEPPNQTKELFRLAHILNILFGKKREEYQYFIKIQAEAIFEQCLIKILVWSCTSKVLKFQGELNKLDLTDLSGYLGGPMQRPRWVSALIQIVDYDRRL
ncbi:unnamed protein product, partial [Allacma fusca]